MIYKREYTECFFNFTIYHVENFGAFESTNFKVREFQCRCCGDVKTSLRLLRSLEIFRGFLSHCRVGIVSGYRCPKHNAAVGGSETSQHLHGNAADLFSPDGDWDISDPAIINLARLSGFTGIGHGAGRLHVDTRPVETSEWKY